MWNRESRRIQLRTIEGKRPAPANATKGEVEMLAVRNALWMVIHCAEQAGLGDVVDAAMRLHLQVSRDLRQRQEAA